MHSGKKKPSHYLAPRLICHDAVVAHFPRGSSSSSDLYSDDQRISFHLLKNLEESNHFKGHSEDQLEWGHMLPPPHAGTHLRAGSWSASAAWGNCPGCSLWTDCSRRPGWRIFSGVGPRTGVSTWPCGSLLCSPSPVCPVKLKKQLFFNIFCVRRALHSTQVQAHLPSAVDRWWCFCPPDRGRAGRSHRPPWQCRSAAALGGSEGSPP